MKSDTVQLEFKCPKCGESGLTPHLSLEKAIAVAHGDLQLRCPHCTAIIEITEPLAKVMLKAPLQKAVDTISSVFRGARKDFDQRAPGEEQQQLRE